MQTATEASDWSPPLAAHGGYIGNVMVSGWYLQMVFQVKIIFLWPEGGLEGLGGIKILQSVSV